MPKNFYELLEVSEDAPTEEIKRAYRGKVREYHPDVNEDDRATEQFHQIRRAYETLSNPERRKAYDRLGHTEYVRKRLRDDSVEAESPAESDEDVTTGGGSAETVRPRDTSPATASRTDASDSRSPSVGGQPRQATPTGGVAAPTDARSEHDRARVRRQIRRRRVVSRWGEPALGFATLWAMLIYITGAAWYLGANRDPIVRALRSVVAAPTTAPDSLNGHAALQSGLDFATTSAADGSVGLLFPVGAALLAVTLFATVVRHPARWRHPAWWSLPVLGAGPAIGLLTQFFAAGIAPPMLIAIVCYGIAPLTAFVGWVGFLYSRL